MPVVVQLASKIARVLAKTEAVAISIKDLFDSTEVNEDTTM